MPRIRTFLAVELAENIHDRLISLQEQLAIDAPEVRWEKAENFHITLLFLGDVDQLEVVSICRAAQKAIAELPSFTLTVEGASCFPNSRRPHTLWVGCGAGAEELRRIHDAIETPLENLGLYRRETRVYTPHVTIGRVKSERRNDALAKALVKHQTWSAGETHVSEVVVMSSEQSPDGPVYTVMGRAKLAT